MNFTIKFEKITLKDLATVGGKNASLGQMIRDLKHKNIAVPTGFAVTAQAYWHHVEANGLLSELKELMQVVKENSSIKILQKVGKKARALIDQASLPEDLAQEIIAAYDVLSVHLGQKNVAVAVRSSATAEDLQEASFAGQQESYLHIKGHKALLRAYKQCLASLFTDRAIMYRIEKGFDHFSVGLSVGIQQMVRSDLASSGVIFTIDTESGFKESIIITSSYGLGESIVKGEVIPDEFHVFKPMLGGKFDPIIKKQLGTKKTKKIYGTAKNPVVTRRVLLDDAQKFSLTDAQVCMLATHAVSIEEHYSQLKGSWSPMDIEWAKDGKDGQLYIVQARPETIHAQKMQHALKSYTIKGVGQAKVLVTGQSVGQKVAQGVARIVHSVHDIDQIHPGEILVTRMTDPDWVPVMKKAAAIITESGGRTCHAAIVSRELGIPAIVGAQLAMKKIKNGQYITVDCSTGSEGKVYDGKLEIVVSEQIVSDFKNKPVSVLLNIAAPEYAYSLSHLPVEGVGLARLEFIITNGIQMHPMACVHPEKVKGRKIQALFDRILKSYASTQEFFVHEVARGVATIAAAFYPRSVLVRFSDFKSNEYRGLLGGEQFEPLEENPMMGLRGASRYYHPLYQEAFLLECQAIKYAREKMGLTNINVMVPFVRTVPEGKKVIGILRKQGLVSGDQGLQIYMMCEIPSNVLLIEEFGKSFDAFSIGSNDLTQTTLSVDRDSGLLTALFDERDPAVIIMLQKAIEGAHKAGKKIGICGQAPSDHPEIAQFLIDKGIDSLSLNPDSVLPFLLRYNQKKVK